MTDGQISMKCDAPMQDSPSSAPELILLARILFDFTRTCMPCPHALLQRRKWLRISRCAVGITVIERIAGAAPPAAGRCGEARHTRKVRCHGAGADGDLSRLRTRRCKTARGSGPVT